MTNIFTKLQDLNFVQNSKLLILFPMLVLTLIFNANVSAQESTTQLSVSEIIARSNLASYYAGDDGSAQARMIIVDENGQKQMRQFIILRQDKKDLGDQNMLVFFSRPSNVKDTVFRVEKHIEQNDNRWLYLPALDLVKRISAGDKRTSFVGSHFFYEDVSGRNPNEDTFTLISENNENYILNAVPKNKQGVEFSSYTVTISKSNFLPVRSIYFNKNQQAVRKMTVLKVQDIDGNATVMKSRITDLSNNSYTEMQFRKVKYDIGLPNNIFSERSMRTPPKAWLK
jgi:hypothetical protein